MQAVRCWIVAGCAVLAFLAVQSCEKGDPGPSAPQLSTIHVNQDKIGLGQQVVFTVEDTVAMHGSLYLIQPRWTVNGNQVLEDFTHYDFVNGRGWTRLVYVLLYPFGSGQYGCQAGGVYDIQ